MSNVLLVAVGAALEQRIIAIPGHRVIALDRERAGDLESLRRTGETFVPDIVFVGANVPLDHALTYTETVHSTQPGVPVILVAEPSAELLLRAMRAGVRDVIANDTNAAELESMVETMTAGMKQVAFAQTAVPLGPNTESKVIVVASPKGGVGKTTVSTNLAVAFARVAPMNTVLIDLDLQFGDASAVLDLHPTHTLDDALSKAGGDTLLLKTFLTVHPAGFYVLCGAESPVETEHVTPDQIRKLITQLSGQFKYVVIDTAAGIAEATLSSLEEATDIVLISSMDVSCIRAMRKEIGLLNELGLMPRNRHVVLNYVDRRSGMTVRDIEKVIGLPVNIVIPRSDEVQIAANRGEPFMLRKKTGPIQKAIRKLVDRFEFELTPNKLRPHHKGVDLT